MSKANKKQVAGNHYQSTVLQHWDIVAIFDLDYYQGNVSKYLFRWRDKGGIQDLEKAKHYLEKYIEIETARSNGDLTTTLLNDALKYLDEDSMPSLPPIQLYEDEDRLSTLEATSRCGACGCFNGHDPECPAACA